MIRLRHTRTNPSPFSTRLHKGLLCLGWAALLGGCGAAPDKEPPAPEPVACVAPEGHTLGDIESVTDWINAMPKPLTLPCFLESLPRPMGMNITQSVFSAQPSNGQRNPRIFIFKDRLILSVVPQEAHKAGSTEPPKNILELSYRTEGISSIKAELLFPIAETLPYSATYLTTVRGPGLSICGICHSIEEQVGDFDGVPIKQSYMLAPYPSARVNLVFLIDERNACNPAEEAHRCAMLNALVGEKADIHWVNFPAGAPTL